MPVIDRDFEQTPIDRREIPQHALDIETRVRRNLFPWRGQFSPGLVDVLLANYARAGDRVADPFAGVGTTLFEAAHRRLSCVGTELNPAAVAMADTVQFVQLALGEREAVVCRTRALLGAQRSSEALVELVRHAMCPWERNLLTNTLIRVLDSVEMPRAFDQHAELVLGLPYCADRKYGIELGDARRLSLLTASIDLILTSPPYINVFNYHQNNRPAMELLGWDLLEVARSEFGANRKHRGNRFLTVVQYCLDMHAALEEMRRVLMPEGRAILVVGRISSVRGIAFQNGSIVSALAAAAGLRLTTRQERKFKSRFGEMIYEDILHFTPAVPASNTPLEIAQEELSTCLATQSDDELVSADLHAALASANCVLPSPVFRAPERPLATTPACASGARWRKRTDS